MGGQPCGSSDVQDIEERYTKEYFDTLAARRYEYEDWFMAEFDAMDLQGKKVLEIGYGQGSDHLQLAKRGAILSGISLAPKDEEITRMHLELNGYHSDLITGDCENLPYEDNLFDMVYTFGAIHHTPNMEKAVDEIYRVLKPGGIVWCGVYNKNSFFYRCQFIPYHYLRGRYKTLTKMEGLSLYEYPCDNKDIYVRVTTKKDLFNMFSKFTILDFKTRSIDKTNLKFLVIPIKNKKLLNVLGRKMGWYNVIIAQKRHIPEESNTI